MVYTREVPLLDSLAFETNREPLEDLPLTEVFKRQQIYFALTGRDLLDPKTYKVNRFKLESSSPAKLIPISIKKDPPPSPLIQKQLKKIQSTLTLDAPELSDDFYTNLMDWKGKTFAIALGSEVYRRDQLSTEVEQLPGGEGADPSAIRFISGDDYLAVARGYGSIEIWDHKANRRLRTMSALFGKITDMKSDSETGPILYAADSHGHLSALDLRMKSARVWNHDAAHLASICGLAVSKEKTFLATGANDNTAKIWDIRGNSAIPVLTYRNHHAAIRAIDFCPWNSSMIATGGGEEDRTLQIWNVNSGWTFVKKSACAQVTSLIWNREFRQIVTTHGSQDCDVKVWKCDSQFLDLYLIDSIYRDSKRVINAVVSPDKTQIATAHPDREQIRFWPLWKKKQEKSFEEKFGRIR